MAQRSIEKQISWACPCIQPPAAVGPKTSLLHILATYPNKRTLGSRQDSGTASTVLIIQPVTTEDADAPVETARARARYAYRAAEESDNYRRAQAERRYLLLARDARFRSLSHSWTTCAKSTTIFESKEPGEWHDPYDNSFSTSDVLVVFAAHENLAPAGNASSLVQQLCTCLMMRFPKAKCFRFALFFPREEIEHDMQIPEPLLFVFGNLGHFGRSVSLDGATTQAERDYVELELRSLRRRGYDSVEIHKVSLDCGYMVPKVDSRNVTMEMPSVRQHEQDIVERGPTPAINIRLPRIDMDDATKAWIR